MIYTQVMEKYKVLNQLPFYYFVFEIMQDEQSQHMFGKDYNMLGSVCSTSSVCTACDRSTTANNKAAMKGRVKNLTK